MSDRVDIAELRSVAAAVDQPAKKWFLGDDLLGENLVFLDEPEARHIAACGPQTIRAVADYALAMETLLAQCADYMELADVFKVGREKIRALLERGAVP